MIERGIQLIHNTGLTFDLINIIVIVPFTSNTVLKCPSKFRFSGIWMFSTSHDVAFFNNVAQDRTFFEKGHRHGWWATNEIVLTLPVPISDKEKI